MMWGCGERRREEERGGNEVFLRVTVRWWQWGVFLGYLEAEAIAVSDILIWPGIPVWGDASTQ